MKKSLLALVFSGFLLSEPALVNGIAFYVNGSPVTILELLRVQQRDKVSQDIAVDRLINQRLHKEEIEKRKIVVTELDIEDEIKLLAKKNNITPDKIKSFIEGKGINWESYKNEIKSSIEERKLYQAISSESLKMVSDQDLRNYYEENKNEFSIPQSIDVVKFYSYDNVALEQILISNGKNIPKNVKRENEILQTMALNPRIVSAFTQTKIGAFTPIFPIGDEYVTFLIKAKNNPTLLPFENVKEVVRQKMLVSKEDYLIYEYFEKLRSNAKVDIVRLK